MTVVVVFRDAQKQEIVNNKLPLICQTVTISLLQSCLCTGNYLVNNTHANISNSVAYHVIQRMNLLQFSLMVITYNNVHHIHSTRFEEALNWDLRFLRFCDSIFNAVPTFSQGRAEA